MITEDFVSFETAKLLKEKGFDEATNGYYPIVGKAKESFHKGAMYRWNYFTDRGVAAPTLQMAMKWLREVHKLAINIEFQIDFPTWKWRMYHIEPSVDKHTNFKHYDTYEEACEAAIKYCLENLI